LPPKELFSVVRFSGSDPGNGYFAKRLRRKKKDIEAFLLPNLNFFFFNAQRSRRQG